jgi:hypothetical protein
MSAKAFISETLFMFYVSGLVPAAAAREKIWSMMGSCISKAKEKISLLFNFNVLLNDSSLRLLGI